MAKLPEPRDPTLEAVDKAIVQSNRQEARSYLGVSALGHDCERRLWMGWRWVKSEILDATNLRRIMDGFAGEPMMVDRLKAVPGINLSVDGPDGRQWSVSAFAGHLQGHLDGAIKGLLQAPKTWHVWEHKQVGDKGFRDLNRKKEKFGEKNALAEWNGTYMTQAQVYMGLTGMKRHYMTVASPGGREITSVRTDFEKPYFDMSIAKAKNILESSTPPPKISSKPDYYQCRWCHLSTICHDKTQTAAVNCRTCAHATPVTEDVEPVPGRPIVKGPWRCDFHDKSISLKRQRDGCPKHLFIPELIPWAEVKAFDHPANEITYVTENGTEFVNAETNDWKATPRRFASKDLQHIDSVNIDKDTQYFEHLAEFDASIIGNKKGNRSKDDGIPFDDPIPPV